VLPAVLTIFLTVLFPFVYNVLISFSDMSLRSFRDWQLVGIANYRDILSGDGAGDFWWLFVQTIAWTAINVTLHVVIGVFLAVLLNGATVGKSFYRVVLVIPWAVPAYITAISWRGMFDSQFGSVNHVIAAYNGLVPDWLQVAAVNWLGTHGGAFAACSIANVWLGFPFMMIIALGGLQGIPAELYEAARIDRASRWMQFRYITLPLLKPVLLPSITLGVIWTYNNHNIVWLVSNGGEPGDSMHILVSRVYKDVFNLFLYGRGAAFSMVIFVILLGFAVLFLRRSE
jgi:arabinogalactan oligomer/maltooligosaccharide transport system permease protein